MPEPGRPLAREGLLFALALGFGFGFGFGMASVPDAGDVDSDAGP